MPNRHPFPVIGKIRKKAFYRFIQVQKPPLSEHEYCKTGHLLCIGSDNEIIIVKTVKGEIVTEEIHAKNTFEEPECVTVKKYDGTQITEKGIRFTIPACSVLHLEVR